MSLSKEDFVAGMTWGWVGVHGQWATQGAEASMRAMTDIGVNWVAIAFQGLQQHAQDTQIRYNQDSTVRDDEVLWAIQNAKSLGLKVCLKPVVNCMNGTWRAHINFFDHDIPGEPTWSQWFASYTEFVLHYAKIAEDTGCEMFCVGCEMVQTDRRESEWRQLIARVRTVYSGPITYNCDKYQETYVTWWDAVDVISSSGYYPVGRWEEQLDRIEPVVKNHGKPFFFMETGCPSRVGSENIPNDWSHEGAASEEAQDSFYEEMFAACDKRPWVQGYMLWDWPAQLYDRVSAHQDAGYCMYGKKAEERIRTYYVTRRR